MKDAAWSNAVLGTTRIQLLVLTPLVGAVWLVAGKSPAASCLLGALAVLLPNLLVGGMLWLRVTVAGQVGMGALLAGEGAKLLLIFSGLYGAVRLMESELAWPAFIIGILAALKAQWLALWFTRENN